MCHMHKGTTIRVDRLDGDAIDTTSGCFKLGPMPPAHRQHTQRLRPGSILVTAHEAPENATSFMVSVHEGCGCQFLIYPESRF